MKRTNLVGLALIAVARELIKFMTSPEAAALLRKTAMEPAAVAPGLVILTNQARRRA